MHSVRPLPSRYLVVPLVLSAVVATSLASSCAAAVLYGTTYSGPTDVYSLDQTAGAATSIGPTGRDDIGDMTSDTRPGRETIWAVRIGSNDLYTIDPVSGAATSPVHLDSAHNMVSIAFDVVTGMLYGTTSVGFGAPFEELYQIDPATGVTTRVGRIGVEFPNVFALGFDQDGQLFGVSDGEAANSPLIHINTATGEGTQVASIDLLQAFDMASRPEDNVMFIVDSATGTLYTINTSSGSVAPVGPYGTGLNIAGLAFSAASPTVVPEPAALVIWSIFVSCGLVALAGGRRRAQPIEMERLRP